MSYKFKTWKVDEPKWTWPRFYNSKILGYVYFEWTIAGRNFFWGF